MTQWTPMQGLKEYGVVLARKMGYSAAGWLILYFISQPCRNTDSSTVNVLALFSLLLGAIGGLVIGWYMATDSVEDSGGLTGMPLFTMLVIASWLPIGVVEAVMLVVYPRWPMGFGGWMAMMSAMLMALAASVWHASTQE